MLEDGVSTPDDMTVTEATIAATAPEGADEDEQA